MAARRSNQAARRLAARLWNLVRCKRAPPPEVSRRVCPHHTSQSHLSLLFFSSLQCPFRRGEEQAKDACHRPQAFRWQQAHEYVWHHKRAMFFYFPHPHAVRNLFFSLPAASKPAPATTDKPKVNAKVKIGNKVVAPRLQPFSLPSPIHTRFTNPSYFSPSLLAICYTCGPSSTSEAERGTQAEHWQQASSNQGQASSRRNQRCGGGRGCDGGAGRAGGRVRQCQPLGKRRRNGQRAAEWIQ